MRTPVLMGRVTGTLVVAGGFSVLSGGASKGVASPTSPPRTLEGPVGFRPRWQEHGPRPPRFPRRRRSGGVRDAEFRQRIGEDDHDLPSCIWLAILEC